MSRKPKNSTRALTTIVREIRGTFRNDIANIIKRGNLLQEAKDQLEHGQWLPWLEDNFSMDERTAQRAMAVAKFAIKYDRLSDLNLAKGVLYELAGGDYPAKVVRGVLKEAETKLVNIDRFYELDAELNPPPEETFPDHDELKERFEAQEKQFEAEQKARAEAAAEAEQILDGPPPDLPPPASPPAPVNFVLAQFNSAIKALSELQTKSVSKFAGTSYVADDLRKIADFLCAVAGAVGMEKKAG